MAVTTTLDGVGGFADRWSRLTSSGVALTLGRLALFAAVLAIWQYLPGPGARFWISDPVSIGAVLLDWIWDGTLLRNVLATLKVMAAGYAAGCVCGIAFGLLFGLVRPLDR